MSPSPMTPTRSAACAPSFSLSGTWPNLPIEQPSFADIRRRHLELDKCLDYSLNE